MPPATCRRRWHDAAGQTIATVDALSNYTTFTFDAVGRQTVTANEPVEPDEPDPLRRRQPDSGYVVNPLGNRTTSFAFDAADLQNLDVSGSCRSTCRKSRYDAAGRTIATIDPLSHYTTTTFDAASRKTSETINPLNQTVHDEPFTMPPAGPWRRSTPWAIARRSDSTTPTGKSRSKTHWATFRKNACFDAAGRGKRSASVDPLNELHDAHVTTRPTAKSATTNPLNQTHDANPVTMRPGRSNDQPRSTR